MNSNEIQKIFQTIAKRLRCPHCGKHYAFENIHILNSTKSICFLQLECENHLPVMASIAINGPKIMIEKQQSAISVDDILDAHEKISQISTIEELFNLPG